MVEHKNKQFLWRYVSFSLLIANFILTEIYIFNQRNPTYKIVVKLECTDIRKDNEILVEAVAF